MAVSFGVFEISTHQTMQGIPRIRSLADQFSHFFSHSHRQALSESIDQRLPITNTSIKDGFGDSGFRRDGIQRNIGPSLAYQSLGGNQ